MQLFLVRQGALWAQTDKSDFYVLYLSCQQFWRYLGPVRPIKIRNITAAFANEMPVRSDTAIVTRIVNVIYTSNNTMLGKFIENTVYAFA